MKYAIVCPCDQTITYLMNDDLVETTNPQEAKLWNNQLEAQVIQALYNSQIADSITFNGETWPIDREKYFCWIEEVTDEQKFRSSGNTWMN